MRITSLVAALLTAASALAIPVPAPAHNTVIGGWGPRSEARQAPKEQAAAGATGGWGPRNEARQTGGWGPKEEATATAIGGWGPRDDGWGPMPVRPEGNQEDKRQGWGPDAIDSKATLIEETKRQFPGWGPKDTISEAVTTEEVKH